VKWGELHITSKNGDIPASSKRCLISAFCPRNSIWKIQVRGSWLMCEKLRKGSGISPLYPVVMTNIAMGNGPFIDGLSIKNGDFPSLC